MRYINYKKMIAYMITILLGCFIFCACDVPKKRMNESISYDETKKDEAFSYIENTYGFAEKTLYGEYKAVTTRDGTSEKADSIMKFKEGSKGGAVFFKQRKKSEKA